MKRYYAEADDGNYIIFVAVDDPETAVFFPAIDYADAAGMDYSNIDGMTADEMKGEYPEHVFAFDPTAGDFETIKAIKDRKKFRDGWHTIQGEHVYIEDGKIRRAMKGDLPAAVYRWSRAGRCWVNDLPITPAAFAAGIRRETIAVK